MGKINLDFMFANTPTGEGKTYTRPQRELNIFDYLLSSAKERSQAPLVLPRTGTPVHEQAFSQLFDEQKEEENKTVSKPSPLLECLWCSEPFERWENSFLEISCKECSLYMREKYPRSY